IVFDSLQDEVGAEFRGEPSREGRLADSDGPLDRDVPPHPPVRTHPRTCLDVSASTGVAANPQETPFVRAGRRGLLYALRCPRACCAAPSPASSWSASRVPGWTVTPGAS